MKTCPMKTSKELSIFCTLNRTKPVNFSGKTLLPVKLQANSSSPNSAHICGESFGKIEKKGLKNLAQNISSL